VNLLALQGSGVKFYLGRSKIAQVVFA